MPTRTLIYSDLNTHIVCSLFPIAQLPWPACRTLRMVQQPGTGHEGNWLNLNGSWKIAEGCGYQVAGIEGNEMYRIREHFVYACLFVALLLLRTINHIRPILLVVCSTLLRARPQV